MPGERAAVGKVTPTRIALELAVYIPYTPSSFHTIPSFVVYCNTTPSAVLSARSHVADDDHSVLMPSRSQNSTKLNAQKRTPKPICSNLQLVYITSPTVRTEIVLRSKGPSQKFAEAQRNEQNSFGRVGVFKNNRTLGFKWCFEYTLVWESDWSES